MRFASQAGQGGALLLLLLLLEKLAQGIMISYETVWPHFATRAFAVHILFSWGGVGGYLVCCGVHFAFFESLALV